MSGPVTRRLRSAARWGGLGLGVATLGVTALGVWSYGREVTAPPFDRATTELHFVEVGAGPRKTLLIHGLAGSARYWTGRVASLGPDHALLIPDLLGFGQSPKPRARYDLGDHLAALDRLVVRRGFDAGQPLVVGHSLGAVIALGMVSRHPGRFRGAVLIGIPVYRDRAEAVERLGAQSPMFRGMLEERWWLRASHYVRFLYRWAWLAPRFELPVDVYLDAMQHTWNSLEGTLRETILGTDPGALLASAGRTPLLFIHGEADRVAPIAAARALAGKGSAVRFVALPGADHQLLLRDPETVWSMVRGFEDRLTSVGASAARRSRGPTP